MFKVNQKVWCAIYGAGVVTEILHASEGTYPVVALFKGTRLAAYTSDGKYSVDGNVPLFPHPVEVVKSVAKPSINWSHVSPEYNHLAQDASGAGFLYCEEPYRMNTTWGLESPYIRASTFTSYVPGTCDWTDSLVKRPD